jgi:diguanylate cyclase (GGDEF)-like protein
VTTEHVDGADSLFEHASRRILRYLAEQAPMGFWAVTRVENGRQTYLAVEDGAYGLRVGGSHDWEQSFCIHMASGRAPRVAPDAARVPAYRTAGVRDALEISAYAGAAIEDTDGSLFGAICGLDPDTQPDELRAVEPLLLLLSELLTVALAADRERRATRLHLLEARLAADSDALTGVHTRRAWDRLLAEAQESFSSLADPTAVVMVDLDGLKEVNDVDGHAAGDDLLVRAAGAISRAVRHLDPVARLGGDEFAVLLRECSAAAAADRADEIRRALLDVGVAASVGVAAAEPGEQLLAALARADELMYVAKGRRD